MMRWVYAVVAFVAMNAVVEWARITGHETGSLVALLQGAIVGAALCLAWMAGSQS